MTLRPKQQMPFPLVLLFLISIAAGAILAIQGIIRSGLSLESVRAVCLIAGFLGPCLLFLILQDQQLRSVELNDNHVSSLVRVKKPFPRFFALERITIPWADVTRLGVSSLTLYIENSQHRIAVNTIRFPDPNAVFTFVDNRIKQSKKSIQNQDHSGD